jgi:hypothetical protein
VEINVENADEEDGRQDRGADREDCRERAVDEAAGNRGEGNDRLVADGVDDTLDLIGGLRGPVVASLLLATAEEHVSRLPVTGEPQGASVQGRAGSGARDLHFGCGEAVAVSERRDPDEHGRSSFSVQIEGGIAVDRIVGIEGSSPAGKGIG